MSFAIVVDVSVARAAGESSSSSAQKCRSSLDGISNHGHRLAMSQPIQTEWLKPKSAAQELQTWNVYASRYALQWLTNMTTKGRVVWLDLGNMESLRDQMLHATPENLVPIVTKDVHILLTALATDRRVLSLDDKIAFHFGNLGQEIVAICDVLWLNPVTKPATEWLHDGAIDRDEWHLCRTDTPA